AGERAAKKIDSTARRATVATPVFNKPMNTPSPIFKLRRNIKALFLLGFIITALNIMGGGTLLLLGHAHQDVAEPVWKTGQHVLLIGATNLMVYLGLFFQVRKALSQPPIAPAA